MCTRIAAMTDKKKRGQPPKQHKRNERVDLRVFPDQKEKWLKQAEKEGKTLSQWLTEIADKKAKYKHK